MSLLTNRTSARCNAYERVVRCLDEGRRHLQTGIELDEKFPDENKIQKIRVCEIYKKGIDCFREAMSVNIMDVTAEKRAEVREMKEKASKNLAAAQDRFVFLTNKFLGEKQRSPSETRATTSSAVSLPSTAAKSSRPASTTRTVTATTPRTRADLLRGVDTKFGNALLDEMLDKTDVAWDDVFGCETAKQALEEAVIYPALNPSLFSGLRQPVKGILLFGPPGNGKTLLAKALATESNQTFFNISAASLTSKWVGESEKTVRSLFQIARNGQPCIIFIDEIDSILCERSDKEAESSRRLKTEFLIQFDGASSSDADRILVIGATNRPYELDDAMLRRFPKRIMLGLPDERGRYQIIAKTLRKHKADKGILDWDLRNIAARTEGYSNSDLVALCREAAMAPVRQLNKEKLRTTNEKGLRPLKGSDFTEALNVIKPSTNPTHFQKMREFAERCGQ